MKKYLVIGNPIDHSLSPKLHNYWFKKNNINAIYESKQLKEEEIKNLINGIRYGEISGINVTVPFKKSVIPFLDILTDEAKISKSVNTIYKENEKIIGHNTDIVGFKLGIKKIYNPENKKILILGAGGVVPSLIIALYQMNVSKIYLSNRTHQRALELKEQFKDIELIKWGQVPDVEMLINATSLGLKSDDKINLNFEKSDKKKFYYDIIYNPHKTNFLREAEKKGNITENGKLMFIFQAQQAFKIWHKIEPEIDENINEVFK